MNIDLEKWLFLIASKINLKKKKKLECLTLNPACAHSLQHYRKHLIQFDYPWNTSCLKFPTIRISALQQLPSRRLSFSIVTETKKQFAYPKKQPSDLLETHSLF